MITLRRAKSGAQDGVVLLAVLWLVILLSYVAVALSRETGREIRIAGNDLARAQARALADAALHRAVQGVGEIGFETRWRADGRVYLWRFAGGQARISIQDVAGKINLNLAPEILLRGLLVAQGSDHREAAALAAAIADFRDPNDLRRLNGAEDRDYRAAGYRLGAKDAAFEALDELRLVYGMTPELYRLVRPLVTVHGRSELIDPATAPAPVLRAVPGVRPSEVERFLERRAELGSAAALDLLLEESWPELIDYLSPIDSGYVFHVWAEAEVERGGRFVREAVVQLGDDAGRAFSVLAWGQSLR